MKPKQINKVNKNKKVTQMNKGFPTNTKKYPLTPSNPWYPNPKPSTRCHSRIPTTKKANISDFHLPTLISPNILKNSPTQPTPSTREGISLPPIPSSIAMFATLTGTYSLKKWENLML